MTDFFSDGKWIAYVGPFSFPDGGAAARRIMGMAKSLTLCGYRVLIISGQKGNNSNLINLIDDGIAWTSTEERNSEHLPRILKHISYLNMGSGVRKFLETVPTNPTAIFLYSGYTPYILQLRKYAKKRNIPFVFDCVEWYQHESSFMHWISPYYLNVEFAMRFLIPRMDGVIVISEFLREYYAKKNCLTIKIPPTLQIDDRFFPGIRINDPIKLVYTGLPYKKDRLDVLVESVCLVNVGSVGFELTIAGPDASDVLEFNYFRRNKINSLPDFIKCTGRVSHAEAVNFVGSAHFSVLIRPDNKVSRAGFSTKMVESMANGTPLIANITGDMGEFVIDGRSGIVVDSDDVEAIVAALRRVANMSDDDYCLMRENAFLLANESFDFKIYVAELNNFLANFNL